MRSKFFFKGKFQTWKHKSLISQRIPEYPSWHSQVKLPGLLKQLPWSPHGSISRLHSSISSPQVCPLKPVSVQSQKNLSSSGVQGPFRHGSSVEQRSSKLQSLPVRPSEHSQSNLFLFLPLKIYIIVGNTTKTHDSGQPYLGNSIVKNNGNTIWSLIDHIYGSYLAISVMFTTHSFSAPQGTE